MTAELSEDRLMQLGVQYDLHLLNHGNFRSLMEQKLATVLSENGLLVDTVTSRVKDREQFLRKAGRVEDGRLKYDDPMKQITDIVGIRVVTYLQESVPLVEGLVPKVFKAGAPERHHGFDRLNVPGYQSVHYLVQLTDEESERPEYLPYRGLVAELQIRTLLQHAWAQIQHDMLYKGEVAVPVELERRLTSLAGLLELADKEFQRVNRELEDAEAVEAAEVQAQEAQQLSAGSLRDLAVRYLGQFDVPSQEWFDELLTILRELMITDLGFLERILDKRQSTAMWLWTAGHAEGYAPNQVELVDALLRAELGQEYIDRRLPSSALTSEQEDAARAELTRIQQLVGSL